MRGSTLSQGRAVVEEVRSRVKRRISNERWFFYGLLIPAFLVALAVVAYPLVRTAWMSVHRFDLMRPDTVNDFVGLGHYRRMFGAHQFRSALVVSLVYTASVTALAFLIGMGAALLVHAGIRGGRIFRTLLLVPWAVPGVIVGFIFVWMFNAEFGVMNHVLSFIVPGVETKVRWLLRPKSAMVVVILVAVYKTIPLNFLLHLAGLQAIPSDFYEAAAVDGAGAWGKFRYVSWPALAHVRLIAILLTAFYAFREFGQIFVVTGGGPSRATETLAVQVYIEGLERFQFGYASAIGVFMILIALAFAVFLMRLIRTDFFG